MKKITLSLVFGITLALFVFSTAFAIVITVDGIREAAWDGTGGQTPESMAEDPNEPLVDDRIDLRGFSWTNDADYMYFLLETWGNVEGLPGSYLEICLDSDTQSVTGQTSAHCGGMVGVDRTIVYRSDSIDIYAGAWEDGETPLAHIGDNQAASATVYFESRISFADLGIPLEKCGIRSIPTALYTNDGSTANTDNAPDVGTVDITCGSPTIVSFSSVEARSANTSLHALIAGAVLLASAFTFAFVTRKPEA